MEELKKQNGEKQEHTLRLACGHFVTILLSPKEVSSLGEEIEQNNPQGKTAYCHACKSHAVITCVYN